MVLYIDNNEDGTIRILLAEDDKELYDAMKLQLEWTEYETDYCGQGQEAFYYASEYPYDVIILDRTLPQMDGFGTLSGLRRMNITTPVIITTALDGINDRIDDLNAGANDYLVKPYVAGELLARIRALTRQPEDFKQSPSAACSSISLDPGKGEPTGPLGTLQLSKRESVLMGYLIRNKSQVLPRGLILLYIQGPNSDVEEGDLDSYIYFLRHRLKSIEALSQIKTVHGIGYRLEVGGTHD